MPNRRCKGRGAAFLASQRHTFATENGAEERKRLNQLSTMIMQHQQITQMYQYEEILIILILIIPLIYLNANI